MNAFQAMEKFIHNEFTVANLTQNEEMPSYHSDLV
jgi:hypothetical protein